MPGSTPILGLPYPLPADAVTDYPALGQQLATRLEALGGLNKLWDSKEAGAVFPATWVSTPTLPQTYKHLLVAWAARGDLAAATSDTLYMRFNSDANPNYSNQRIYAFATTVGAAENAAGGWALTLGDVPASGTEPASLGGGLVLIPDYAMAGQRPGAVGIGGSPRLGPSNTSGFYGLSVVGGRWATVTPVTSLGWLLGGGTNLVAPFTRFTVYGLG